jgi:hypothetical protein
MLFSRMLGGGVGQEKAGSMVMMMLVTVLLVLAGAESISAAC